MEGYDFRKNPSPPIENPSSFPAQQTKNIPPSNVKEMAKRIAEGTKNLLIQNQGSRESQVTAVQKRHPSLGNIPIGKTNNIINQFGGVQSLKGKKTESLLSTKVEELNTSLQRLKEGTSNQSSGVLKEEVAQVEAQENGINIDESNTFKSIKELEISYHEILKEVQQKEGKVATTAQIYQFLLRPNQEQFREDFLVSGPWMGFIREDLRATKPVLIQEMERAFEAIPTSFEKENRIMQFAIDLVERGLVSKEAFQGGIFSTENRQQLMNHAKWRENDELISLVNKFHVTGPIPKMDSKSIEYQINKKEKDALGQQFERIASGRAGKHERKQFIQDFAQDLTTLTSNIIKHVHPTELYNQAWTKVKNNKDLVPNTEYLKDTFNSLSNFVVEQILKVGKKEKDSIRLYAIFVEVAYELATKHHDYQTASSILGAFSQSSISRLGIQEALPQLEKKHLSELNELYNFKENFKNLRNAILSCETNQVPYVPYFPKLLSDFTFLDDGNPSTLNEIANMEKLKLMANSQKKLERAQSHLQMYQNLHYDVKTELANEPYYSSKENEELNEERRYKLSEAISLSRSKLVRTLGIIRRVEKSPYEE